MKGYLPTALALVCVVLVVALFVMKHGDDAQHETDAGTIAGFSNQLDSAQTQIAIEHGTQLILSNSLAEYQSASATFSNQLTAAQSALALDAEQITNLNQQLATLTSENQSLNQTFGRRVTELTNQVAGLTAQLALTETNLARAGHDYGLLENRLQRDVAERLVVERKFHNLTELKNQMDELKENPIADISAANIYAGLDVEVTSNGVHVIAPN